MNDTAISVKSLSKTFKLPHEKKTSLKEHLLSFKKQSYEEFKALKGINFEVKRGEFFGVIGRNGSGKSTLLKIIGGIYQPTTGEVIVNGTLTPFIELGIGFNPELTGKENIYLNGAILGLTRKDVKSKYNEIVAFAELERFMDQKLKNYSSGMQVRLAFAIAIQAHNDILLIDEVLAVGDVNFQEKCYLEFNKIKKSGKTVIFISHDLGSVQKFCDRAMIINDSEMVDIGDPQKMVLKYGNLMADMQFDKADSEHTNMGTGKLQITKAELIVGGKQQHRAKEGQKFTIRTHFEIKDKNIGKLTFGVSVVNQSKINILAPNTSESDMNIDDLPKTGYIDAIFESNPLATGSYSVVAGFFNERATVTHDYVTDLLNFKITGKVRHGITNIEPRWSLKNKTR